MSTTGLLMMVATEAIITAITIYFFWKVLTTPPRKEPDSYSANDDVKR